MTTMNFPLLAIACVFAVYGVTYGYKIGVGRADCTGPPVEIVFMGYANMGQRGHGIHLRQYSRAFIIENNNKRVVFVSFDGAMVSDTIRRDVIKKLQDKYGNIYTIDNVVISATHSHGTPGGFMMYLLYDMTTFGFVRETHGALVEGVYNSIVKAHEGMQNGRIYIGQTEVLDANINRSPTAYLNNPAEERAQYQHDTDRTLTQMRFVDDSNEVIGAINWFAVHPTSMNNTNRLITTDNVGYAAILLESAMNPDSLPGKGDFVGAFAATNLGDVSPNTMGPKCELSGNSCDILTSSCPTGEGACFASGPGRDQFESTKIIATKLFEGAIQLLRNSDGREVKGDVKFMHQYIDMPATKVSYFNPITRKTKKVIGCSPAMGYSFAAGTTDGPGAFDFTQGTVTDNPLWNLVRDFLATPTEEDIKCQAPKPILLATGRVTFPYDWQPKILSTQAIQIGDVILAAVPSEFTTMSGRRIRNSLRNAVLQAGGEDVQVIVAGLSNMYSSYVATPEEYEIQRYEGASTIYGPHTLTIYIDQYQKLVQAMVKNEEITPGPTPPLLDGDIISLTPPVIFDSTPLTRRFGDVVRQPNLVYRSGERASARFQSANPRNNLHHDGTYLTIEKQNTDGEWIVIATDSNWETSFIWESTSMILGHSNLEVYWDIDENVELGIYRIRHFGVAKTVFGRKSSYIGTTRTFMVSA